MFSQIIVLVILIFLNAFSTEKEMINNVFEFDDKIVSEIMKYYIENVKIKELLV